MEYICPECGYTDEYRGRCPQCNTPLVPINDTKGDDEEEE